MFHYGKIIFDLQILILMFIQSERERDYTLYAQVLKSIIKYIFAFNHYNYARWFTIYVDDLMELELVCTNVYKEFCSGNFVIRKTINPFSAIALDQAHKQKNAIFMMVLLVLSVYFLRAWILHWDIERLQIQKYFIGRNCCSKKSCGK